MEQHSVNWCLLDLVQCAPLGLCYQFPCPISILDVSGTLKTKSQFVFILSRTTIPIRSNPLLPDSLTELHTAAEEDWLVWQEHVPDNYFIHSQAKVWRCNESKMSKNKQFPSVGSFLFFCKWAISHKNIFSSSSFSPISWIRTWVFHGEELGSAILSVSLQLRRYIRLCTAWISTALFLQVQISLTEK